MFICKGENAYKCSKIKSFNVVGTQGIRFFILDAVTQVDIANLFDDDTFYFYDDVLQCRLPDTNNTKLVGLSITYNADSTCKVIIKLKKGVGDDES